MTEITLGSRASLRFTAADRRHAETIAEHIRRAGGTPTPTLVLRIALARLAIQLEPAHAISLAMARRR